MDRRQLDLGRTATSLAQRIDTRTHDKPPQPGFEPVWVAQTGQVPPGPDETFLDRVSRELVIPEDQAGRRIQPRDERAGKRGKGVMIASPGPLDELSLVHDHPQ